MTLAPPRLTIRMARPCMPVILRQPVTFRSNGWTFTGVVVAVSAPRDVPSDQAVDITLEGTA